LATKHKTPLAGITKIIEMKTAFNALDMALRFARATKETAAWVFLILTWT
jgi:hypothetical protein